MLKYKVAQNYPKFAQKVATAVYGYMKMDAIKRAQKVNIHLGYFCKKICHQKPPNLVTLFVFVSATARD